jgi:deoxyribonuclease V
LQGDGWDVDFRRDLQRLAAQVPRGRVATCGDLAEALGDRRAARAVFVLLARGLVPSEGAHRVVTAEGRPVVPGAEAMLAAEGVPLAGGRVRDLRALCMRPFAGERPLAALRREQARLAKRVVRHDDLGDVKTLGGCDVAYDGDVAYASVVVLDAETMDFVEACGAVSPAPFPYIPTYLGYRELPAVAACLKRLETRPSVLLVDGHGVMHPRRFGVASFLGVKLNLPAVGVAKRPLAGEVRGELQGSGDAAPVREGDELLGYALLAGRSRRPIFVSTGHRVGPDTALALVRRACRSRIPEPLRWAHRLAKEHKERGRKDS